MLTQQDVINAAMAVMMEHYDRHDYVRVFSDEVYQRYGVEAKPKDNQYYLHDPLMTTIEDVQTKKLKSIHQQIDICILMHSAATECIEKYNLPAWAYGVEPPCYRWLYGGIYETV